MSQDNNYIEKLVYDPELEKSWFTFFTDKFRVIVLVIIAIIISGVGALRSLPLESTPEVDLGMVMIGVALP